MRLIPHRVTISLNCRGLSSCLEIEDENLQPLGSGSPISLPLPNHLGLYNSRGFIQYVIGELIHSTGTWQSTTQLAPAASVIANTSHLRQMICMICMIYSHYSS